MTRKHSDSILSFMGKLDSRKWTTAFSVVSLAVLCTVVISQWGSSKELIPFYSQGDRLPQLYRSEGSQESYFSDRCPDGLISINYRNGIFEECHCTLGDAVYLVPLHGERVLLHKENHKTTRVGHDFGSLMDSSAESASEAWHSAKRYSSLLLNSAEKYGDKLYKSASDYSKKAIETQDNCVELAGRVKESVGDYSQKVLKAAEEQSHWLRESAKECANRLPEGFARAKESTMEYVNRLQNDFSRANEYSKLTIEQRKLLSDIMQRARKSADDLKVAALNKYEEYKCDEECQGRVSKAMEETMKQSKERASKGLTNAQKGVQIVLQEYRSFVENHLAPRSRSTWAKIQRKLQEQGAPEQTRPQCNAPKSIVPAGKKCCDRTFKKLFSKPKCCRDTLTQAVEKEQVKSSTCSTRRKCGMCDLREEKLQKAGCRCKRRQCRSL